MRTLVSASLLAADKNNLLDELKRVEQSKIDFIHFDVMDNQFVPNISFLDGTFTKIRKYSSLPFEVHLMVNNPLDYIDKYDFSKEDVIIIHYECFKNAQELMSCIKQIKKKHRVGISIKPHTEVKVLEPYLKLLDYILIMSVEPGFGGQKFLPSALDKIKYLSERKKENHYLIEVDGGINEITGQKCKDVGVDILVSGSYLFNESMKERVELLR